MVGTTQNTIGVPANRTASGTGERASTKGLKFHVWLPVVQGQIPASGVEGSTHCFPVVTLAATCKVASPAAGFRRRVMPRPAAARASCPFCAAHSGQCGTGQRRGCPLRWARCGCDGGAGDVGGAMHTSLESELSGPDPARALVVLKASEGRGGQQGRLLRDRVGVMWPTTRRRMAVPSLQPQPKGPAAPAAVQRDMTPHGERRCEGRQGCEDWRGGRRHRDQEGNSRTKTMILRAGRA